MDSLDHLSGENSTPENNNKRTKEDLLKSLEEKREQQNQETPQEFAERFLSEIRVDIDLAYYKEHYYPNNDDEITKQELLESLEEKREQQNQETPLEFALRVERESDVDIDLEYYEEHNIEFEETDPLINTDTEDDLWNRLSDKNNIKKAFDFVTSLGIHSKEHNVEFEETDPLIDTYTENDVWNAMSNKNNIKKAFDFVTSLGKKKEL